MNPSVSTIRQFLIIAGISTTTQIALSGEAVSSASNGSTDHWDITGAAGLSLADGNAESLSYTLQLLATKITATDEIYLGADYFYGDNQGIETTNSLRLFGQYNRNISDRFYAGVNGSVLTDEIADLDYRFDVNGVLGYYLYKSDRAKLSFEGGPGYTMENQGGISNDYVNFRVGQRFEYAFNSRSKFWQTINFTTEMADLDNHLVTAEVGIDTLLTKHWTLRTFVRHQEDNTPALGRKSGDTTAMLGLAYSLGGFPEPAAPGRRTLKAERAPSPIAAMGWSTSASLGYTMASGNSDNMSLTGMLDSAYRSSTDELFFNAAATYAENIGETSIDNIRASAQYNHLIGERYFVGAGSGFLRDDLAQLDYRFTPVVVAGVYLFKTDDKTLSLEAGPGYTLESNDGEEDRFLAVQAAERFIYTVSPRCTLNQSIVYNAEAADAAENFTVTASAFLDTDITQNLALRIAVAYIYDNTPSIGRERHDTNLTSGIAVRF